MKHLTVDGAISASTDLYLGAPIDDIADTYTASTITGQEKLTIKGRGVR